MRTAPRTTFPRRLFAALGLVVLTLGAARASAQDAIPPRPRWTYRVTLAPDATTVRVRWCLHDFQPRRVWLADAASSSTLRVLSEEGGHLVRDPTDDVAMRVEGMAGDACFEYELELRALLAARAARRSSGALIVRPGAFLLRAGYVPDDLEATISFDTPSGVRVAAPFDPAEPGVWRLPPSTWPFQGWVVVGSFAAEHFVANGCSVELVRIPGPFSSTPAGVRRWVETAIGADATLFHGTFPRPRLVVTVEPSVRADEAVPFGSAWAGGGPHAMLLLSTTARDEDLPGEWVSVHELLHTTLPHISTEDAWLAEGLVTYYQEVLRARAGIQSPAQAWGELNAGFHRGRASDSRRPIETESRFMHENHEYHRVYWSGAAISLRLDVELRRTSGNRLSVDDLVRAMKEHPDADRRSIPARECIAALDRRLHSTLATNLVDPLLTSSDFPSLVETYRFLGLEDRDGRLVVVPGAPGESIRDAIMARASSPAPQSGASGATPVR